MRVAHRIVRDHLFTQRVHKAPATYPDRHVSTVCIAVQIHIEMGLRRNTDTPVHMVDRRIQQHELAVGPGTAHHLAAVVVTGMVVTFAVGTRIGTATGEAILVRLDDAPAHA